MSSIFIHFIYLHQKNHLEIKERNKVFLCEKDFINSTEKLMKNVEMLNSALKSQAYLQMVSIFFPGLNLATLSSAQVRQMIQLRQKIELVSYLKNIAFMRKKKCAFDPATYKTPYRIAVMDFERAVNGETILRTNEWKQVIYGKNLSLKAHFTLKRKFPLKLDREVSESSISGAIPY